MARPRKRLPIEFEQEIRDLAFDGLGAAQIHEHIQRKYGASEDPTLRQAAAVLDYKTVLRRVQECSPPDDSEPWTLAIATPEEAAVVMPVLGAVLLQSTTRRPKITVGLARWIVKVAAAAPSLPPDVQYLVARAYRAYELQAKRGGHLRHLTEPEALDAFLACRPWESADAADRYERLLAEGIVKQPLYLGAWWRDIAAR